MLLKDLQQYTCYGLQEFVKKVIELEKQGLNVFADGCQKIGEGLYLVLYSEKEKPKQEVKQLNKEFLSSLSNSAEDKEKLSDYAAGFGIEEDFFDKRKGIKKLVDSFVGKYHAEKNK